MDLQRKGLLYRLILSGIVIGTIVCMLYFGCKKEGYHVDEVYSYGLANSEYLPFMHFGQHDYNVKDWMKEYALGNSIGDIFPNLMKDFNILKDCDFNFKSSVIYQDYLRAQANSADTKTTTWVSGKEYLHYVTASPENRFNYASVYYNQRGDVHPPFFYILLHTICSIFPESFSKWYGLVLNMVFMLLTMRVLYKLCDRLFADKFLAVAILALYGFSNGFMTTAMFLRMYAILTFFVLAGCYLHLAVADEDFCLTKRRRRQIAIVTLLGFLTHYYFVIYAIGIAAVYCIWMVVAKKTSYLFRYIGTMITTAVIGLCVWPFAVKHVFFGYRGQGSFHALAQVEVYFIKIKLMVGQLFGPMLQGKWWIWVLLVAVLGLTAFICRRRNISWGRIGLISIPALVYVLLVSQIVPFYTERYVMCIFPFVCITLLGCVYYTVKISCERLAKVPACETWIWKHGEKVLAASVLSATLLFFVLNNCFTHQPGYLFTQGQETVKLPENTDCVFVLPDGDWNESAEESTVFAQARKVGVVYESNLEVLSAGYTHQYGDYLMVFIQKNLDEEAVMKKVKETFGVEHLTEVSRSTGGSAVRILLGNK